MLYLQNSKLRQMLKIRLEYYGDVVPLQISVNKMMKENNRLIIAYITMGSVDFSLVSMEMGNSITEIVRGRSGADGVVGCVYLFLAIEKTDVQILHHWQWTIYVASMVPMFCHFYLNEMFHTGINTRRTRDLTRPDPHRAWSECEWRRPKKNKNKKTLFTWSAHLKRLLKISILVRPRLFKL